jgi:porin
MNTRLTCKTLSLAVLVSATSAWGQSNTSSVELPNFSLERLKDYVSTDLFYTHDYISNTGGAKAGPRNLGALDLYIDSDLSKYSSVQGEMQFHYLHVNQNDTRGGIGDSQAASNIDMPTQVDRMVDVWYQHNFSDHFNVKVGLQDISMEYDITESSLSFLNSSFGIGPDISMSGPNGAGVWPITGLGIRSLYNFTDELSLRTGIFDANPGGQETYRSFHSDIGNNEGLLHISELAHQKENRKIGGAVWNYSKTQEKLSGNNSETSFGAYGIFEQKLNHSLWTFFRAGWGNPVVNVVHSNIATGVVYKGLFQKKKTIDEVGAGVTRAHMSKGFLQSENAKSSATGNETAYEAYYNFKPMKILSLRPDVQYITNPSGVNNLKDAWAVGLRSVVEL